MVFGRTTYDSFAGAWPEREQLRQWSSRSWWDKEQDGHIALSGSVSVVRQLLAAGLVDELHLFVHPIAVGSGERLFADGSPTLPLKLLGSQAFTSGVLHLVYGPDAAVPHGSYEDAKAHLPQDDERTEG